MQEKKRNDLLPSDCENMNPRVGIKYIQQNHGWYYQLVFFTKCVKVALNLSDAINTDYQILTKS